MLPDGVRRQLEKWGRCVEPGRGIGMGEPARLSSPQSVSTWWRNILQKHPSGWAQFSDSNVIVIDGKAEHKESDGVLLAAELYLPDSSASFQLRTSGRKWVAVELTEVPCEFSVLETETFHGRAGVQSLTYQVAWAGVPLRRSAVRLVSMKLES